MLTPWKKNYDQPRQHIKKQRQTKVHLVKAMVFPAVMYGCGSWTIESLVPKNRWFWTGVLEKTLENPLDCKKIQPVNPKGNQTWIFIGRTDAKAETPILWLLDAKNWLTGKDPDAGKDWRQDKGTTEDEMVGWYHRLNEHEFEQVLGVGDGQGSLVCCRQQGRKESDTTERLNWTECWPGRVIIWIKCGMWKVYSRESYIISTS